MSLSLKAAACGPLDFRRAAQWDFYISVPSAQMLCRTTPELGLGRSPSLSLSLSLIFRVCGECGRWRQLREVLSSDGAFDALLEKVVQRSLSPSNANLQRLRQHNADLAGTGPPSLSLSLVSCSEHGTSDVRVSSADRRGVRYGASTYHCRAEYLCASI